MMMTMMIMIMMIIMIIENFINKFLNKPYIYNTREIKLEVTWSYVKRQTAKMKLLPSAFSSLNSRVKIFVFHVNSRRRFFYFCLI